MPADAVPLRRAFVAMAAVAFRADPLRTAGALVLSAVMAALTATSAWTLGRTVDAVASGELDRAVRLGIGIGALEAAAFVVAIVRLDLRFRCEEATRARVDEEIIEAMAGRPGLDHHERPDLLDKVELLRLQRTQLAQSVAALIENAGVFAGVAGTVVLLATLHPLLVLLPVAALPMLVAGARVERWVREVEERTAEDLRHRDHVFEQVVAVATAAEVRVFGLVDELRRRWLDADDRVRGDADRLAVRVGVVDTLAWTCFAVAFALAVGSVAARAVAGDAGPGDVVLAVVLAQRVNADMGGIQRMISWLLSTLRVATRYVELVDGAERPTGGAPAPQRLVDGVRLDGVGFRYPGTDPWVLRRLDLHVPAGSTVALVGENGAGKTTLVKLLCGFYEPTEGRVLVDGVDLAALDPVAWRDRLSAGFQDGARFAFLAGESFGVGDLERIADPAALAGALDRAAATDVVEGLVDGLATQLGREFDGAELSGGQWQKLAIARALLRPEPLLLLLDEPAAALDADAEHAVVEGQLAAARHAARDRGAITLLVSHRLSSVRHADLIVVVADGGVAEAGTHDELVAAGGAYAELFELQARTYR